MCPPAPPSLSDFDPSAGQQRSAEVFDLLWSVFEVRYSPLSLLLSEKAALDEKILLISFFFSTGANLQMDM